MEDRVSTAEAEAEQAIRDLQQCHLHRKMLLMATLIFVALSAFSVLWAILAEYGH